MTSPQKTEQDHFFDGKQEELYHVFTPIKELQKQQATEAEDLEYLINKKEEHSSIKKQRNNINNFRISTS